MRGWCPSAKLLYVGCCGSAGRGLLPRLPHNMVFLCFLSSDKVSLAFSLLIGSVLWVSVQFKAELITREYRQWAAGLVGPAIGVEVNVA